MTMSVTRRARQWLTRWSPILPLLIAEGTIWIGFGALLPVLPLYITEHGTDLQTLGLVIAAWPAARLVGEPVFGALADRTSRKWLMVTGLLLTAVFAVLPLFIVGPAAFIVLRAFGGLSAAIYDPAARGYLMDANPPERQGETFGLYGAAQMGGLMVGPAIGGVAAAATGTTTVVFWVASFAVVVSALLVLARVPDLARRSHGEPGTAAAFAASPAATAGAPAVPEAAAPVDDDDLPRPNRVLNTLLLAAIAFNVGSFFAGGSYEVVWSLYLTSLGAGLDLIGLTFFTFALPILVLSPFFGQLVDRRGGFAPLVVGMAGVGVCGMLYPIVPEVWFVVVLGLFEGAAFALASPALYLLVSRAAPPGRSSTAQGIFGAAGTIGTISASLAAGYLAAIDLRYPFWATGIGILATLLLGLVLGGRPIRLALRPHRPAPVAAVAGAGMPASDMEA